MLRPLGVAESTDESYGSTAEAAELAEGPEAQKSKQLDKEGFTFMRTHRLDTHVCRTRHTQGDVFTLRPLWLHTTLLSLGLCRFGALEVRLQQSPPAAAGRRRRPV